MPETREPCAPVRTSDEIREIARSVADGLVDRGLTLHEIERTAAVTVDFARSRLVRRPGRDRRRGGAQS